MALNINNITPASLKAKEVATQEYVDTEISAADSKDELAQRLGYISYADMEAKASAGQTVINGGLINADLINVDTVFANEVMSKNITFTGNITGGNAVGGGVIKSYDGSMEIDLVNGSIYIS